MIALIRRHLFYKEERKKLHSKEANMLQSFLEHKCLFFHIPKAGGISVSKTLFGSLEWGHKDVAYYQNVFGKKTFENLYKFTVVRNPFDRLLSGYNFLQKGGMNNMDKSFSEQYLKDYVSFEDFILNGLENEPIKNWVHFRPQHSFITNKHNKLEVDFIAKLENIKDDFKVINAHFKRDVKLLHENKSEKTKQIYSTEMKKIIKSIYKRDFELFYPELL
jgi:hypothetical protein